jgi:hypothetical protein
LDVTDTVVHTSPAPETKEEIYNTFVQTLRGYGMERIRALREQLDAEAEDSGEGRSL